MIKISENNITKPILLKIDEIECYLAEDIFNYDRAFFTECSSIRLRSIITKKSLIEDEHYIYGYYSKTNNLWIKSKSTYPKAKLLLLTDYVENNVPKFKKNIDTNINDYQYEIAPEILFLIDDEKFKNIDGKIINIEVRGEERNHNKCYFKMKDVSEGFELPNLYSTLLHKNGNYLEHIHYKYFTVINKSKQKKEMFLTYEGLKKILYCSRNLNLNKFKIDLSFDNYINITNNIQDNIKQKKTINKLNINKNTPGIYFYIIGNAKKLLEGFNYNEEYLLCKYGKTTDIQERHRAHIKNFKKEFNTDIKLHLFSLININNISIAEYLISKIFEKYKIKYKSYNELIIIKESELDIIKKEYDNIQNLYLESIKDIKEENINLKNEINKLKEENIKLKLQIYTLK